MLCSICGLLFPLVPIYSADTLRLRHTRLQVGINHPSPAVKSGVCLMHPPLQPASCRVSCYLLTSKSRVLLKLMLMGYQKSCWSACCVLNCTTQDTREYLVWKGRGAVGVGKPRYLKRWECCYLKDWTWETCYLTEEGEPVGGSD